MSDAAVHGLVQQGGFAILAAVCVWAIVAVVKIGVVQMERGHLREVEGIKLSVEAFKMLASDRETLLRQTLDTMLEVRTALVGLQDEIGGIVSRNEERGRAK